MVRMPYVAAVLNWRNEKNKPACTRCISVHLKSLAEIKQ